jgi:hypothetical protein
VPRLTLVQWRKGDQATRRLDTRRFAGCLFFVVQGRRETEARQGFRAAGLRHKALEDEAWGAELPEPATNRPVQAGLSSRLRRFGLVRIRRRINLLRAILFLTLGRTNGKLSYFPLSEEKL